jgi:hypothetical protein
MATPIKVRSPYIVEVLGSINDTTKVEIFLWNDPGSVPSSPQYTLEKNIDSTVVSQASYDISPYIREFIAHTSYTEINADTAAPVGEYCYCNTKVYKNGVLQTGGGSYTEELICFDGFGYFADGQNPTQPNAMLTEGTYYVENEGNTGGVYYTTEPSGTWQAKWTGLESGTTSTVSITNTVGYVPYIPTALKWEKVKLEFLESSVVQYTYNFTPVCEPKYTVINCDFVNKHGAWQRLVFFKASKDGFEMSNTEYNLMADDTDYSLTQNRRQVFNVNAKEKITCNTGWVPESYKEVIKELMLSEVVRLDNVPVILDTKSVDLKKSINENVINYEVSFRYAFDALNYNV